jgi:hypothetical protein
MWQVNFSRQQWQACDTQCEGRVNNGSIRQRSCCVNDGWNSSVRPTAPFNSSTASVITIQDFFMALPSLPSRRSDPVEPHANRFAGDPSLPCYEFGNCRE